MHTAGAPEGEREAARRIIGRLLAGCGRSEVQRVKHQVARELGMSRIPPNSTVLRYATPEERRRLLPLLRLKPVRTLSGVAVVAVMAKPAPCPGECIYCPKGKDAPQSYTGEEPAALRARSLGYEPFSQVHARLLQLRETGHAVSKVELIVMGGTFPALPSEYRRWFIKECLDAMSSFPGEERSRTLEEAIARNERAGVRNVGITLETRPDYCRREHVDEMLEMGVTRVELGVQSLSEEVYRRVKRGHTLEDVVEATRVLKDAGLKVCYHMMPGLFSTPQEDLEMFRELFSSSAYMPDMLKLYPALVLPGTELHRLWKEGEFTPYSTEEAVRVIAEVKSMLPPWVRTMRIQRDIPARLIAAGVKKSNLAELVQRRLEETGRRCRCIRCREVGRRGVEVAEPLLRIRTYTASGGRELFLSIEDEQEVLLAYLRLRYPSESAHRWEVEGSAVVRELRVLGEALPLGERGSSAQHRGYGRWLLEEAERLAAEAGYRRVLVTSAIGTREYYRRLGYERYGAYMAKELG